MDDDEEEEDKKRKVEKRIASLVLSPAEKEIKEIREILKKTDRQIMTAVNSNKKYNNKLKRTIQRDTDEYQQDRERIETEYLQKLKTENDLNELNEFDRETDSKKKVTSPNDSIISSKKYNRTTNTAHTNQTTYTNQTKDNTKTNFYSVSPKSIYNQKGINTNNANTDQMHMLTFTDFNINFKEDKDILLEKIKDKKERDSKTLTAMNFKKKGLNENSRISVMSSKTQGNKNNTKTDNIIDTKDNLNLNLKEINKNTYKAANCFKKTIIDVNSLLNNKPKETFVEIHSKISAKKLKTSSPDDTLTAKTDNNNNNNNNIDKDNKSARKSRARTAIRFNNETGLIERKSNISNMFECGKTPADARRDEINNLYHKFEKRNQLDDKNEILNYMVNYLDMDKTKTYEDFKKNGKINKKLIFIIYYF